MKLTSQHAEYWRQRTSVTPKWAQAFNPVHRVSIDGLINASASIRETDGEREKGNLLALLRIVRKRGPMVDKLQSIALTPVHLPGSTKRRIADARKWAQRIKRASDNNPTW